MNSTPLNGIGTLRETSLHADLKRWYAQPGDSLEARVDGYIIDIVRGDLLIEIQTRSFTSLKRKLHALVEAHPVRLVYPIPQIKWIVRLDADGETQLSRRKSPRRSWLESLFKELLRFPDLMAHDHFTLEALLIEMEEFQREDGRGSWRRKGRSIADRRLLAVISRTVFHTPADFLALIPAALAQPFTTRDLARSLGEPLRLAQKMAYCLSRMGTLLPAGSRDRFRLYILNPDLLY